MHITICRGILLYALSAAAFATPAAVHLDLPVMAFRTSDGLNFKDPPLTVLPAGREPDVVLLTRPTPSRNGPDAGTLICYALSPGAGAEPPRLVRSTSVDQGRSWSSTQDVAINGWPKDLTPAATGGPAAVQLDDGRVRLYFGLASSTPRAPGAPIRPTPRPGDLPGRPDAAQPVPAGDAHDRIYSAISNDGLTFAFEDGHRFELAGCASPDVIRLPDPPAQGDDRRIGPWLMFLTRDDSTVLATSRDGLTWARDETFVWTSATGAGGLLTKAGERMVRLYGRDRTGVISAVFDPATGEIKPDGGARFPSPAAHPAASEAGDGATLLVCEHPLADTPRQPDRRPPVDPRFPPTHPVPIPTRPR